MRIILLSLGVSLLSVTSAIAHPISDAKPQAEAKTEFKLPSEADIEKMIDNMPDFNGIMTDMSKIMKDDKLRSQMETTAKSVSKSLKNSGALKTDGEMPDINLALETLLRSFADKDGLGGMLGSMTDMAETMSDSFEKHMPETAQSEAEASKD